MVQKYIAYVLCFLNSLCICGYCICISFIYQIIIYAKLNKVLLQWKFDHTIIVSIIMLLSLLWRQLQCIITGMFIQFFIFITFTTHFIIILAQTIPFILTILLTLHWTKCHQSVVCTTLKQEINVTKFYYITLFTL